MANKITLTDLVNLTNQTTAVNAINTNNEIIELGIDNTLSRDGTQPNQMGASLDMNSNRIINLPQPSGSFDPVRLVDINTATTLAGAMAKSNNLSDVASISQSKINLALVKGDVGLGNVDNTSDVNKPVSTAQNAAIILKADIASPTFTGVPLGPTAAPGTNTTQLATTAFTQAISGIFGVRLAKSANYTVLTGDNGATIALGGSAFFTLTFPAASGLTATHRNVVVNEDSIRAKNIVLTGGPSFTLYPGQTTIVFNQNNVWQHTDPGRWRLTGGPTVFVDVTNGNDSNDGLAAGAGGAFQTLQKAWNTIVKNWDLQGFVVTIQLADGTYTSGIVSNLGPVGGIYLGIIIQGNAATPSNVLISTTSADCFEWFETGAPISVWIKNLKMQTTTSGDCVHVLGAGNYVRVGNVVFGACAGVHIRSYNMAEVDAFTDSYTITGGAAAHYNTNGQGVIGVQSETITLTGTPAFSSGFAVAQGGNILAQGNTYSGAATGARYNASLLGLIDTAGGGANYFPGSIAGATLSGGIYN